MKLSYIRHAQHIPMNREAVYESLGLTETGLQEARSLHDSLGDGRDFTRIVTFDHIRALGTLSVVTDPLQSLNSEPSIIRDPRLEYDEDLDYIDPGEDEFGRLLFEAYMQDRNFQFLAKESDRYYSVDAPISSLTYMASSIATEVLRRSHTADENADVLLCSREFLLPSLRAKLIKLNEDEATMFEYIDWYTQSEEAKDHARQTITVIESTAEGSFMLMDAFALSNHSSDELQAVVDGLNDPKINN